MVKCIYFFHIVGPSAAVYYLLLVLFNILGYTSLYRHTVQFNICKVIITGCLLQLNTDHLTFNIQIWSVILTGIIFFNKIIILTFRAFFLY